MIRQNTVPAFFGAFGVSLFGFFGFGFRHLRAKQKQTEAKQQAAEDKQCAVERGMQALLRDRLVTAYYKYKDKGYITLHGLEAMDLMYTEYHNLGGNGTVTRLMEDMREMEVRDH